MYSILRCYRCYMLQTVTEHPRRDTHSRPPGEARQKEPTERAYMTDVRTPLVVYHAAPLIPSPAVPRGAGGVEQQRWAAGLPPPPPGPSPTASTGHSAQRARREDGGGGGDAGGVKRSTGCQHQQVTHTTHRQRTTPPTPTHTHTTRTTPQTPKRQRAAAIYVGERRRRRRLLSRGNEA